MGRGLSIGARPVVKLHRGIARIPVTRPVAIAALFSNGIVFATLISYAIVATFDNYRTVGSLSEAFYSQERTAAAPALFTLMAFTLSLIQFARRRYLSTFRISAPVTVGIAGFAAFLVAADPDITSQITRSFQHAFQPSPPVRSQMWTGQQ